MKTKLQELANKKRQLDALKPLPQELQNQLEDWLKVELTYSSNAIEGNTLTRAETAEAIEKGVRATISGKSLKDQLEAINHARAVDYIRSLAKKLRGHQFISEKHILSIHKFILGGIDDNWAGRYRETEVFIRGANIILPLPHKVPYLMDEFVQWLEKQQKEHPVKVAALAHLKLVTIHPFVDGNGRTARLMMNLILLLGGYPVSIIKNEDRTDYLDALAIAQTKNNIKPYSNLIENAVERSLNVYLNATQKNPTLSPFQEKKGDLLKIGELAKETNETVPTIRFWTNEGLLKVESHTKSGYQLYDWSMVDQVKKIRKLQNQRLTIAEIKKELQILT
ncbi:MAG: Fic family protein [Patescibacteria group bacterium]